jgi:hypothetical protein
MAYLRFGVSQGVASKAVNYMPVCGTLSPKKADMYTYIAIATNCEVAMSTYNEISATSALYDATGSPIDVQIGDGTPVCLCFSLEGPLGRMDMCLDVLSDGKPAECGTYGTMTLLPAPLYQNQPRRCHSATTWTLQLSVPVSMRP